MSRTVTDLAIDPPVYLSAQPQEPIRSLAEAVTFMKRQIDDHFDAGAEMIMHELENARTMEEADDAASAFRDWAEEEGLLLNSTRDA